MDANELEAFLHEARSDSPGCVIFVVAGIVVGVLGLLVFLSTR